MDLNLIAEKAQNDAEAPCSLDSALFAFESLWHPGADKIFMIRNVLQPLDPKASTGNLLALCSSLSSGIDQIRNQTPGISDEQTQEILAGIAEVIIARSLVVSAVMAAPPPPPASCFKVLHATHGPISFPVGTYVLAYPTRANTKPLAPWWWALRWVNPATFESGSANVLDQAWLENNFPARTRDSLGTDVFNATIKKASRELTASGCVSCAKQTS